VPVETHVETFSLTDANEALKRLRLGRLQGAQFFSRLDNFSA
jgi:hypothetical protein